MFKITKIKGTTSIGNRFDYENKKNNLLDDLPTGLLKTLMKQIKEILEKRKTENEL